MTQAFSSDNAHKFTIDETEYSLPVIGPDDYERVAEILSSDPEARYPLMRDFIYERADEKTVAAIREHLGFKQIGELARAWMGLPAQAGAKPAVAPGESPGSVD